MEDGLLNIIGKAKKVVEFSKDRSTELASTPNINTVHIPKIETLIQIALDNDSKATENTTGIAEQKSNERTELEVNVFHVAAGLAAYAETKSDLLLLRLVEYTQSDVQSFRELALVEYAELVLEKVTPQIAKDLEDKFNVKANDITDLNESVTNFKSYLAKPRQTIAEKKAYRQMAIINVDDIDAELAKITRAMGTYKKSNRLLYEIFVATNTIDDLGVGKSSSNGNVTTGKVDANSTVKALSLNQFDASLPITLSAKVVDLVFSVQKGGITVGNKLLVTNGTSLKTTLGALADEGDELVVINNFNTLGNWSVSL